MLAVLYALGLSIAAGVAHGASLTQVRDWGANPSNISMYIYVPDKLAANPAVIAAVHPCGGSATGYFRQTKLPQQADQLGFILVYPSTTHDTNCWDVATTKTLTHDGGGDSTGIANMVKYTIDKYKADKTKVFVTGTSSGAMMTNVLAGTYPDLFVAGAAFSGVACGCLAGSPGSSPASADPTCANGKIIKTAPQWGDVVRKCYPAYSASASAPYPRMQIWHGKADTFVSYLNLPEMLKQWSNIHGVTFTKNVTDTPLRGYTQIIYGDGTKLVAYSAEGVGHVVPTHEPSVLQFFGLTS